MMAQSNNEVVPFRRTTDLDTRTQTAATAQALPAPGNGYWWRVRLDTRTRRAPIIVELMESMTGNRRALSRVLGSENTTASPKAVAEAAELVLARVIDYLQVCGEFGGE